MRYPQDRAFEKLRARADGLGVELITIDDYGPLDWKIVGRVRQACDALEPRIWHAHDYKSNLVGLLARRSRPMQLVSTVHGWVQRTWKTPLYYFIDRLCLRRYDQVICVSRDLQDKCIELGVAPERCWYVPNGIDTEMFSRRRVQANLRTELGTPTETLVVGAVGRLSAEKGFRSLLGVVRSLADRGQDCELWIVGEGPDRSVLETRIVEMGLGDRVRLLGHRSDMVDVYGAMDLFVLSSLREGFPNVLLEAMAMELPVVATSVAGVPDLIRDGSTGILVQAGNIAGLREGLEKMLADGGLRQRLGKGARAEVERDFSFTVRMDKVMEIYDRLSLSPSGRPDRG